MKNFIYKSMLLASAMFVMTGCEESEIPTFGVDNLNGLDGVKIENANAIRFPGFPSDAAGASAYNSSDDMYYASFSFIENPMAESMDYDIPLCIVGFTSDRDRKVNWVVDEEKTTAPVGTYQISEAVIPAGERDGHMRVILPKVEALDSLSYELVIKLQASDDFQLGPKQYVTAKLIWNNILPAPTNNNLKRSYNMLIKGETNFVSTSLNSYSTAAHLAIVDALGWDDWGSVEAHGVQANGANLDNCYNYLPRYTWIYQGDLYKAHAKILDEYLTDYAEKNGSPLLHDGGKLIGQPVEARKY